MARRFLLVAIIAAAAALVPASAQAATAPTGFSATTAGGTVPVSLAWTTSADDVAQQVFRVAGACPAPASGGVQVDPTPAAPLGGGASAMTDSPPDGTWCYYVQVADAALGTATTGGIAVTVDQPSTGTVAVSGQVNGNFIRGTVDVTGTAADAGSGVASSALFAGTGDCPAAGVGVGAGWTPVGDGTYNVCNVVTDGVGHVTVVQTIQVVVDNTAPAGSVLTPAAGSSVSGNAVALTSDAADATAGVRSVQWRWTGATGAAHNIGAAVTNAANGFQRNWNTSTGNAHPPDGAVTISALITDNAGNAITATTAAVVDNTAPDVRAVVSAPPAVAGSPVLSWTPAHDAVGVTSYDVLRGGVVIGTVPSIVGAAAFSYADKTAPDQATSSYVVRAYDAAGHFTDSAAVSVLVDSTAVSAAKNVTAATPTSAAPVLSWQAPATFAVSHYDVYRDGLLIGSTTGAGATYTDATATEGAHDYAVLARDAAAHPGVLSSSFRVVFDKTAPTSGGAPTAQVLPTGQVNLAWPAAGDALSGVAGYIVRRASGGTPPAALDGGSAVCTPTAPSCGDAAAGTGVWSYGVFARDAAGNVALIGTVSNVAVKDRIAPLAPTKLKVTRPKAKTKTGSVTFKLRWVKPTAADLDRVVVVLNRKRPPVGPADGKTVYHGLGTTAKVKLLPGQNGYLAVYAVDHSGNFSLKPVRKLITLAGLIPLRPLSGSTVRSTSPTLTWKATNGSSYYNVQLFRNGKHVLVAWPSKSSYRIPTGRLKPGTYVWFVWPAVQHSGGSPTFGKLIGRATFTYKK